MFPIALWIPQEYPDAAPITFVTPTKSMAVRAGQYVSAEGRVYHPYLAGWREDVSERLGFLHCTHSIGCLDCQADNLHSIKEEGGDS